MDGYLRTCRYTRQRCISYALRPSHKGYSHYTLSFSIEISCHLSISCPHSRCPPSFSSRNSILWWSFRRPWCSYWECRTCWWLWDSSRLLGTDFLSLIWTRRSCLPPNLNRLCCIKQNILLFSPFQVVEGLIHGPLQSPIVPTASYLEVLH